jgi:hypothetical protein
MSTNASITIRTEKETKHFYNHWDGYPMGLWRNLIKLVENYFENTESLRLDYFLKELPAKYELSECEYVGLEFSYDINIQTEYIEIFYYKRWEKNKTKIASFKKWNSSYSLEYIHLE